MAQPRLTYDNGLLEPPPIEIPWNSQVRFNLPDGHWIEVRFVRPNMLGSSKPEEHTAIEIRTATGKLTVQPEAANVLYVRTEAFEASR